MQLLVFAHPPPPVHGQSLMVQTLLDGLPAAAPEIKIFPVNPRLSRDTTDIGRLRPGKIFALLAACGRAIRVRARHGPMFFYYVPAPGKRAALYRDWLVMLLCRPFFRGLVLHWHAAGLGSWFATRATPPERWLTQLLLGRAALSIVLGENLRSDAALLHPRNIAVVRNGIPDPAPGFARPASQRRPLRAVYLGLCSREKGVFAALRAIALANRRASPGDDTSAAFDLSIAGDAPDRETAAALAAEIKKCSAFARHLGFLSGAEKNAFLAGADVLIFPTAYPHETQGLVVAEALAYDLPVIVTRWRAVHENLPARHVHFVEPGRADQIADALFAIREEGPPQGASRRHFLAHFTREQHLARLAEALRSLHG